MFIVRKPIYNIIRLHLCTVSNLNNQPYTNLHICLCSVDHGMESIKFQVSGRLRGLLVTSGDDDA